MKRITSRNFRILCDFMDVYQFMIDIYEKDWRNGVPAPFLEYALSSDWMDKSLVHRWKIWEDNGVIVGLVFYEHPVNDVYFSLRPGYEELADEMVSYANSSMPRVDGNLKLVIFGGQTAIKEAATKAGFLQSSDYMEKVFDFGQSLDYPLPDGFHFVETGKLSIEKILECCWKGFNHEAEEGPWDGDAECGYYELMAPHMHLENAVVVESETGEYACYAGMWWTPENNLAYMEPLCTVPKYRKKGLASAALSEHYRRLKPLGATHMTGGGDPFYEKIGFQPLIHWTFWDNMLRSLLETTLNTRDLGGYRSEIDGKYLKSWRVLRSDVQNYPSDNDINLLKQNNIQTIIDMRGEKDIQRKPSGFYGRDDFKYINIQINDGSGVPESAQLVSEGYMNIAENENIVQVFKTIANAKSGVMINCTAGKDRTGVVSAILLWLCEVSKEDIIYDYMITKTCNKERFELLHKNFPEVDMNIVIPNEVYMEEFLEKITSKYGNAKQYLMAIGVTGEEIERIIGKLIN